MKKLMNLFCLPLFLGISAFSSGQVTMNNVELLNPTYSFRSVDLRSKDLVGSQFINENFLPARTEHNSTIYSCRYDAFTDQIEVSKDGKIYYFPKKHNYTITFLSDQKKYQAFSFTNDDKVTDGFFVVLKKDNKYALLLKERIKFYEEVPAKTGYDKYQPPKLERISDKYYVSFDKQNAIEIPAKKKDFFKLFADQKTAIETYVKEQKLNIKKIDDIEKLLTYYNTL